MYQTYDVTAYLREGNNGIGCTLASGWWCDAVTYVLDNYNYWGDRMGFLGKLVIVYEDGSREVVGTNPQDWLYYGEGPYTYAGFFNGEHYDARKAYIYEDYSKPGFWLDGMKQPEKMQITEMAQKGPGGAFTWPAMNRQEPEIVGNYNAPVKEVEVLTAKSMTEPAKGVYIYDLGQEIAGVPVIKLRGRKGQKVVIRYAEMLYPRLEEYGKLAGRMLHVNLRDASNTDVYICSGIGVEVYKPKFTFHGFRYIEVSGVDAVPALGDVQGVLLSSVPEITGRFECSNPLVNKLVSNVSYSQRCIGIRRDENRPGYQHFTLQPETGGFEYAKGGIYTPHGRIESAWEYKDGEVSYRCRIPENTTATLILNGTEQELGSGEYRFTA